MEDNQQMEGEENEIELSSKLNEDWKAMAGKQNVTMQFLKESEQRQIDGKRGPSILAFFNKKLDINRFFIEDSDGNQQTAAQQNAAGGGAMPQVETGGGGQDGNDGGDDLEDALNDALCVYVSGDSNQDILSKNEKQILFYIDLENEEIKEKQPEENKQSEEEGGGDQMQEGKHPVLLNQYPLCFNHSLFLLFAEAGLPQILSDELLLLMLQIFKVNNSDSLRIGYNSMGADCIANNLHVHLIYADQMFGDFPQVGKNEQDEASFPIELASKKLFFRTTLQHKNKEEINMYSCPVRFGELGDDWPVKCLLLSPDIGEEQAETGLEDAQEALAHTAGIVLNYLIDQNIPHNILIADDGMTLYVIPRKFDLLIERVAFHTSFESLCGFVKFKNKQAFDQVQHDDLYEQLQSNVSLSPEDFTRMKEELVAKFTKEYEGGLIG